MAAEAKTAGHGGIAAVFRATGVARSAIGRGLKDLEALTGTVRRPGCGQPVPTKKDRTLLDDLRRIVEPVTMGDLERVSLRVSKSHAKLAEALRVSGHVAGVRA